MTGQNGTPGLLQRQPIAAASGIVAAVTAVLAAFWSVSSDAGWLSWLSASSVNLINGAIIITVTLLAGWWAQRHSTPTAAPTLTAGTTVQTVDATGAAAGTKTV